MGVTKCYVPISQRFCCPSLVGCHICQKRAENQLVHFIKESVSIPLLSDTLFWGLLSSVVSLVAVGYHGMNVLGSMGSKNRRLRLQCS